jgi:hypothetical protein
MPENALDGYRKIAEDSVVRLQNQYDWRANWHRRNFRLSGIVVILVSASLPLLAAFDYWWKDLVVAVAGVVIATVTGLRTFYHWDQMWGVLRRTHFDLNHAYNDWMVEIQHAEASGAPAEVEGRAYAATKALLARVNEIRTAESDKFFQSLSFPPQSPN